MLGMFMFIINCINKYWEFLKSVFISDYEITSILDKFTYLKGKNSYSLDDVKEIINHFGIQVKLMSTKLRIIHTTFPPTYDESRYIGNIKIFTYNIKSYFLY